MIDLTELARLRDEEGLSWKTIGGAMGLSPEAARSRYRRMGDGQVSAPSIVGAMPDDYNLDVNKLWDKVISAQERMTKLQAKKQTQTIEVPTPCAITVLSDLHIGDAGTDYISIRRDAKIIQDTDGMYAAFNGDGVDNWIVGKLIALQRTQATSFDGEWQLFFDWLDMLKDKFLFVVSGNHDNWTLKLAGIDRVRDHLQGVPVLYDTDEVTFNLIVGGKEWRVKSRHKWKGSSIFNPTHGIEVSWERGGWDFDIGIGSHTHIGTLHRPFIRHGKTLHAILTSTYKTFDGFGREIGFPNSHNKGSGTMVFDKHGNMQFFDDVALGAQYLTFLKNQ